jgi:hypothetical protein
MTPAWRVRRAIMSRGAPCHSPPSAPPVPPEPPVPLPPAPPAPPVDPAGAHTHVGVAPLCVHVHVYQGETPTGQLRPTWKPAHDGSLGP